MIAEAAADTGLTGWQIIAYAIITSLAGIISAIGVILATRRAKEAHKSAAAVEESMTKNIGIANGHGSLMDQTLVLLDNQQKIAQAQTRDAMALTDHIQTSTGRLDKIHDRVSLLTTRLSDLDDLLIRHVNDSAEYRRITAEKLDTLADLEAAIEPIIHPPKEISE